jgi:hypothetical protein
MEFEPGATPETTRQRNNAGDPLGQPRLHFETLEQRCAYARCHGYKAELAPTPSPRPPPRFPSQNYDIAA